MSTTRTPRHLATRISIAVVALLVGAFACTTLTPGAASADTVAEGLAGVHVLTQVPSAAGATKAQAVKELTYQTTAIKAALATPGVSALAIRVPWNVIDTDFDVLDQAKKIADGAGKELTVRFMAGQHTPARILDTVPTISSGAVRAPAPFLADGSRNTAFLVEYQAFVARLADWARANGVHLVHLSHYAKDWAEFYYGPEVQQLAGTGSANAMVDATNALADIGIALSGDDLAFELPMSGHGPLMRYAATSPPGIAERVTQHVVSSIGSGSDRFFVQGNGWDEDGVWGASSLSVEKNFDYVLTYGAMVGVQMIQPYNTYGWSKVFDVAEARGATYAEVYLPSFSGGTAADLKAETAIFGGAEDEAPPAPTTTAPAPTTTAPAPTTTAPAPTTTVQATTTTAAPTTSTTAARRWRSWYPTTTTTVKPTTTTTAQPTTTTTTVKPTTTTTAQPTTTTTAQPTTTTTVKTTTTTAPSTGDPNPAPAAGTYGVATSSRSVTVNGEQITYSIYTPTGLDAATRKFPLILVGHGQLGNGDQALSYVRYLATAGFVLAAPSMGSTINTTRGTAIMGAVEADMAKQPSVLANRIGYFGTSMGANLGYAVLRGNLGIDASILRAGWASGSGATSGALFAQHGNADSTISISKGLSAWNGASSPKVWTELAGIGHDLAVTGTSAAKLNTANIEWYRRWLYGDTTALARMDAALTGVTMASTTRAL